MLMILQELVAQDVLLAILKIYYRLNVLPNALRLIMHPQYYHNAQSYARILPMLINNKENA